MIIFYEILVKSAGACNVFLKLNLYLIFAKHVAMAWGNFLADVFRRTAKTKLLQMGKKSAEKKNFLFRYFFFSSRSQLVCFPTDIYFQSEMPHQCKCWNVAFRIGAFVIRVA
jgi:hypothetical protein